MEDLFGTGGVVFDPSLLLIDSKIDSYQYKERIISLLQPILNKRFSSIPPKQSIKPHKDRISIACPYCGDSSRFPHKKRGNFILDGKHKNHYKCFNCGIFKRIDEFFKDFDVQVDLEVLSYIVDNLGDFGKGIRPKYDSTLLLDTDIIEEFAFSREEFKKLIGLVEIKGSASESYLRERYQNKFENFLYNPKKNYLAILNTTPEGNILGIQQRKLGKISSYSEKFLTFNLDKLYKGFYPDENVPEEINALSEIFGIFNLNFNAPITQFEGAMDSYLFKNSIAIAGAHKSLPLDLGVRYWFDYDETGIEKSLQHIRNKDYVFLWGKLQRDLNIPYRKKWDLNDLVIWGIKSKVKMPHFDGYFSNDPLDIMDI